MQAGALTPSMIAQHFATRISKHNANLNAFLKVSDAADPSVSGGRLFGIPIGIKNNIAVKNMPLTAGIGARRDIITTEDAPVVRALKNAGAIISGTLNMHEAALGATTDNIAYGRCHNPHKIGYTPGGSSGGSGSAVAAGLCGAALGTDTLGSIRIPAAFCGIYGLKPTFGAVSTENTVPMGLNYDCIGPMARHISDLRVMWSVIGNNAASTDIKRIATLRDIDDHAMDRPVREAYDLAKSLIAGLDYSSETHSLGGLAFAKTLQAALVEIERDCLHFHRDDLVRDPDGFSTELRAFLAFGEKVSDTDVVAAQNSLDDVRQRIMSVLSVCDAIVMPTTPCVPFSFSKNMPNDIAHFTMLANIAGLPALSLPSGWSHEGLPIGVQIVGRPGSENALLDMAQRLDSAAGGYVFPELFNDDGG